MRKRLISKTYLRDVRQHEWALLEKEDCWISVKHIIKVSAPFILSTGLTLIDDGYSIIEIIPKSELYSLRGFFDHTHKLLQYYFDISRGNGIDEDTGIPYYDDLFIDIILTGDQLTVVDEDELLDALRSGDINEAEYQLALSAKERLLKEISDGGNRYLSANLKQYLSVKP